MTNASQGTKIFGFNIPVQQKYLAGGLIAILLAAAVYNFMGSSDDAGAKVSRPAVIKTPPSQTGVPTLNAAAISRRAELANRNKQGVLKLKAVDPNSIVDPTLKLGLLDRLQSVKLAEGGRNLFESNVEIAQVNLPKVPSMPRMVPKPIADFVGPRQPPPNSPPPVNIPLRYYGFVRPSARNDGNRGYFMDGDNILMATEGDVLKSRFLIVALSPNTARLEDIQLKQGLDLQLIPEAVTAQ
jgi:hypothetical protein